jgi:hypothetical protein
MIKLFLILLFSQYQDTIFGSKWEGIRVNSFLPSNLVKIDSFKTYTSGEWIVLSCYATTTSGIQSGDIISSKISGIGIDSAKTNGNIRFKGFKVSGPDQNGYVYLNVLRANGTTKSILRTKLKETKVDSFYVKPIPPDTFYHGNLHLKGFNVSGPDQNGFVWLIAVISTIGTFSQKFENEKIENIELKFGIKEISPNPAREFVRISYSIPKDAYVKIYVYDKKGAVVKKLCEGFHKKGIYRIFYGICDEKNNLLPAGVYFIKFEADKFKEVKKILILK